MGIFTRFFKKTSLEDIEFITTDCEQIANLHPDALFELYNSKKHGFLIKNFLTSEEILLVLDNISCLDSKDVAKTSVGYTYPMVFAEFSLRNSALSEVAQKENAQKYFETNENYPREFFRDFGIDLKSKIDALLNSISGGRQVIVPDGFDGVGKYPFGNFRYLEPNNGFMAIHCGNYFQTKFKLIYAHLTKIVKVENQMSYFIMIQKPEKGGVLDIFNLRWENGQTKRDNLEDREVIMPNGSAIFPDTDKNFKKMPIVPEPGDMILFQGGNIWHRVSKVEGIKPRITFGGFMAMDKSESSFYFWT